MVTCTLTYLATFNMALVRIAADDPKKARSDLREAMTKWSQKGYHIQHHNALLAHVHIELYDNNADRAWERSQRIGNLCGGHYRRVHHACADASCACVQALLLLPLPRR